MSIIEDIKLQYRIGGIAIRLIYWNIAIFILSLALFYNFSTGSFNYPSWLQLSSNPAEVIYFLWTLITYSFLHNGFFHLFFNMLLLHFISRLFLTFFTQKQLFGLYILSALFAGICFLGSFYVLQINAPLVGASASIMAILVATTTYSPMMLVRLIIIGPVKLWYITAIILAIDLMQLKIENTGGHIAHLSAAFFGFVYVKLLLNGTDLSQIVTKIMTFFTNILNPKGKVPFKNVHVNPRKSVSSNKINIVKKDKTQQQIDDILDKISKSGYESLSEDEKQFLFKAGKQ